MPIKAIKTMAFVGAASSMLALPVLACADLTPGITAQVVAVTDGDTVILDSGDKVRLIGLQAPKLPLGRPDFDPWPLADEAKAKLEELSLGQTVDVRYGGAERDRHGRVLGHMFIGDDEIWAQQEMLRVGMARVYSFADNRSCLEQLYRAEAVARAERAGIWADEFYTIVQADRPQSVLALEGEYGLIEGRVLNADVSGSRLYLNFGRDWDTDFTAVIERPAMRLFEADGADPLALQGALVRVRGWVEDWNGPRIEITHPEQIEVLAWR